MTDSNYTAIAILSDHSGSMGRIRVEAEGGINGVIEEQRKLDGKCTVRISEFDNHYTEVYPSTLIADARPYSLQPRGWTALHDSLAKLINDFGAELEAIPEDERPGNVIVVISTDGLENASKEYSSDQVKELVEHQKETYGWDFVFLAANQDAVLTGGSLGFDPGSSLTYGYSGAGIAAASVSLNSYVTRSRKGSNAGFTQEERDAAAAES